jgi:hypothetical protein
MPSRLGAVLALALLASACEGRISPASVRSEVIRQAGEPASEFELTLGRLTAALLRRGLGPRPDGSLPLEGLTGFELAVYGLPPGAAAEGLDFSRITPFGWENVVRYKEGGRSALVMIRRRGDTIRDLALVVAGGQEVVYGRLRGKLPATLPQAIRDAVATGGTAPVKRQLLDLTGEAPGPEEERP